MLDVGTTTFNALSCNKQKDDPKCSTSVVNIPMRLSVEAISAN